MAKYTVVRLRRGERWWGEGGKKEKEKTRRKSALKIRPRISAMSAHPFLPWVYRGLVGRVPEDIDFRVKPAIFSVDNGGTGRGRRFLAAIRKPTPLDTSFSPFFRLIGEEIFQRGEKKWRKENASRGVKRRVVDDEARARS